MTALINFITKLRYYLLIVNLIALILYGIDKFKAKHSLWRIPEKILFLISFIGGSVGALLGMYLFHHKTKHLSFVILNPLFLILQIFLVIYFYR